MAKFSFVASGGLKVEVVLKSFELGDLRIADRKSEFLLGFGKHDPQLAPQPDPVLGAQESCHLLGCISGDERVFIDSVRHCILFLVCVCGLIFSSQAKSPMEDRMQEYTIQRSNRRCQQTDRVFAPGERYYSAVVTQGSSLIRQDFSKEAWAGPPQQTVGWWTCQVPTTNPGKPKLAPTHVLLATLEALLDDPSKAELAYLLCLLLVRRRILTEPPKVKLEEEDSSEDSLVLHLTHTPTNRDFIVPVCHLDLQESEHLQSELNQLLFSES